MCTGLSLLGRVVGCLRRRFVAGHNCERDTWTNSQHGLQSPKTNIAKKKKEKEKEKETSSHLKYLFKLLFFPKSRYLYIPPHGRIVGRYQREQRRVGDISFVKLFAIIIKQAVIIDAREVPFISLQSTSKDSFTIRAVASLQKVRKKVFYGQVPERERLKLAKVNPPLDNKQTHCSSPVATSSMGSFELNRESDPTSFSQSSNLAMTALTSEREFVSNAALSAFAEANRDLKF